MHMLRSVIVEVKALFYWVPTGPPASFIQSSKQALSPSPYSHTIPCDRASEFILVDRFYGFWGFYLQKVFPVLCGSATLHIVLK